MEDISKLIREYIDTPKGELFTKEFADKFNLIPILLACDRRIGKRRLKLLLAKSVNPAIHKIIELRVGSKSGND